MPPATDQSVPDDAPDDVHERAAAGPRRPALDPTLGIDARATSQGLPPNRLVVIGDSLAHGFQSGAVYRTDLSFAAIIAHELGWSAQLRYPQYGGPGGLPVNIELLMRDLEQHFGDTLDVWELPLALFRGRQFLDDVEDYWERGPGTRAPNLAAINHVLAMYGWDLRDALDKTFASCAAGIGRPHDDLLKQVVENNSERAAVRVYPHWTDATSRMTLFEAAAELGRQHDTTTDCGIETLVVFLGSNNALRSVTELRVAWSGHGYDDPVGKRNYTVWRPEHFAHELDQVVRAVAAVQARHVIWCTVPHVTIPPIARGIGLKVRPGSRYFPYYARPWVDERTFDPRRQPHITAAEARAVDAAVDLYNTAIEDAVRTARAVVDGSPPKDWYLLDIAAQLDRLAARRYIDDPNARPDWWTPYPLPPALAGLHPLPDSRFLTGDGHGGRATGGLFSLDGVHPTTVGYGLIANEIIAVMNLAGVPFAGADHGSVDFDRLIRLDTLVNRPPQNVTSGLGALGWADEVLGLFGRALG
ncbi:MAG: hypothetical protein ABI776_04710 [Nocardioidaceae bacterium]